MTPSATGKPCGISISIAAMPLFGRIVDDAPPVVAIDDLEAELFDVEREALGAAREQHLLAGLEPQLLVARRFATGERAEDVVIIDDAILVDFDEARAAVSVRGLEHVGQVLVDVDARAR